MQLSRLINPPDLGYVLELAHSHTLGRELRGYLCPSTNRPSNDNVVPGLLCRDLDDHATDENDAPDHDGHLSPDFVRQWPRGECTEQSANGELRA